MEIELCGYTVLIDDEDYDKIMPYTWYINQKSLRVSRLVYFQRTYRDKNKKKCTIVLSRVILGLQLYDGKICDHINGNTLDNRKENLRICSKKENQRNCRKHKDNKTGFKGIYYQKGAKKYHSQISVNSKIIYLGLFNSPVDAHAAYCQASAKYHGDFGRTE